MSFIETLNNKWTNTVVTAVTVLSGFQSLGTQFNGGGTTAEDLAKEMALLNEKNKIVQVVDGGGFGQRMQPVESNIATTTQQDASLPAALQNLSPTAMAEIIKMKTAGMNSGMPVSDFDLANKAAELQQGQQPAPTNERDAALASLANPATMRGTFQNMGEIKEADGKTWDRVVLIPDDIKTKVGTAMENTAKFADGSAHIVNNTGMKTPKGPAQGIG